jgi:hypothetical protein
MNAPYEPYVTIVEQASAVDRAYFEEHQTESSYIRKAIPGELGPPVEDYQGAYVVVTQICLGMRHRRFLPRGPSRRRIESPNRA